MAVSKKRGIKSSAQDNFLEPNAVTNLTATDVGTNRAYNNGAASLSWTLPAASPPATLYTITSTPSTTTQTTTDTSYTFTGLASNTDYTFTVVASNNAGSSAPTTSTPATRITTVPSAPTSVSVASGPHGGSIPAGNDRITFSAPAANGGKNITTYRIVSSIRGQLSTNATSPFDTADPTLPDNTDDESYTVYVSNANGESAGTSTSAIATFTPPHFPPFFPPFFPPHFPPFFPPFFPPHFPPFFPPHFPPHFPPFFPPHFPPFFPPHFPPHFPPFFPPHFPPFFPPHFPPHFPPFFPPHFPPFFPPHFPPSGGGCGPAGACRVCYGPSWYGCCSGGCHF
jgi:hypothetical protein